MVSRTGRTDDPAARPKDEAPKKLWNGFQWLTQAPGAEGRDVPTNLTLAKGRRLHFGNLPPGTCKIPGADGLLSDAIMSEFANRGLMCSMPGKTPVLSVWMSEEQNFSFVEFISGQDSETALGLDGMMFLNHPIRVARPSDYTPSHGALTPGQMTTLMLQQQQAVQAQAAAAHNHSLAQAHVQMQQRAAAVEYTQAPPGPPLGGAPEFSGGAVGPPPGAPPAAAPAPAPATTAAGVVTNVLVVSNIYGPGDNLDEILEDVEEEAGNHGKVLSAIACNNMQVAIWATARPGTIVGDVFIEFEAVSSAQSAYNTLAGRMFAGKQVRCSFCDALSYATISLNR